MAAAAAFLPAAVSVPSWESTKHRATPPGSQLRAHAQSGHYPALHMQNHTFSPTHKQFARQHRRRSPQRSSSSSVEAQQVSFPTV